jgi:hypothetical protein
MPVDENEVRQWINSLSILSSFDEIHVGLFTQTNYVINEERKTFFVHFRSTSMLSHALYVTNTHFRDLISQRQAYCSTQHKHSTEENRVE